MNSISKSISEIHYDKLIKVDLQGSERWLKSTYIKWLRYQRVISLKIQVGNTNQRNKWANTIKHYHKIDKDA
jgi:hypothetical protein